MIKFLSAYFTNFLGDGTIHPEVNYYISHNRKEVVFEFIMLHY
jgi:hypothetical protein